MNIVLMSLLVVGQGPVPSDKVIEQCEDHAITYSGGEYENETFHYRLLKPAAIEPGKKYPVILFLHGAGERGEENTAHLVFLPEIMADKEQREKYPCFLIAPQCRKDKTWSSFRRTGNPGDALGEPSDQLKMAIAILKEVEQKYPVDPRRVYLTGLSMGGYGSWELAARHPDWFAAVVPICGGGNESIAEKLKDVPIWAVHGAADSVVPVAQTRKMIEAVKKAGGQPKYSELEGVDHDSWTPAYKDLNGVIPWMFQQVNQRRKVDSAPPKQSRRGPNP